MLVVALPSRCATTREASPRIVTPDVAETRSSRSCAGLGLLLDGVEFPPASVPPRADRSDDTAQRVAAARRLWEAAEDARRSPRGGVSPAGDQQHLANAGRHAAGAEKRAETVPTLGTAIANSPGEAARL